MNSKAIKAPADLLARDPGVLQAFLLMTVATLLMAVMHSLVRYVSAGMHPFEIAFFRNLFGLVAVLPLIIHAGRAGLKTHQPKTQIIRAVLGLAAMLTWFYGLSIVPIAQATALSFTSAIFASLGAVLFLGERMRLRRWTAVCLGFLGVLMILRPGFTDLNPGALLVVVSAMCWGCGMVVVKRLSATDDTVSIVALMSISLTVLSFFPALFFWTWPSWEQLAWLLLIGITATLGHLCMTRSLKLAEATAVLPLDFTRLIWASIIGFIFFAEIPDIWTWVGGTVIFASAAFIAYREAKLKHRATVVLRQA